VRYKMISKQIFTKRLRLRGLQARMTFSYVWISFISVLLLEILVSIILVIATFTIFTDLASRAEARRGANEYAQAVAGEVRGTKLDPHTAYAISKPQLLPTNQTTYDSGMPVPNDFTVIPTVNSSDGGRGEAPFIVLLAPDGRIIDSSFPQRYGIGQSIFRLLPDRAHVIADVLAGHAENGATAASSGRIAYATQVVSKNYQFIGAIYAQIPVSPLLIVGHDWLTIAYYVAIFLPLSGFLLLFIIAPIGGIFGSITTRSLVQRIHILVTATTHFSNGDYAQRVTVAHEDEIGQLETQFNRMAEQLVTSIQEQQKLTEQNARLAERARISRELHDAISQDLFSLSMLAGGLQTALPTNSSLQQQMITLEQTTGNVIREMRALLLELRPPQLEQGSLTENLRDLTTAYRTRLDITITTDIADVSLPASAEHALLRIAQEALANAVRHANASAITLSLVPHTGQVELTIADDGMGFEPNGQDVQHGLGLRLMRERVQELNGTFQLISNPGKGTHIQVCLPLREKDDD
jgi:two-component system, NarL family, sensor histidine kinase LiaS